MLPLRRKHSLVPGVSSERVAKELVPELDEHLAALAILFHQYLKHTWVGPADGYGTLAKQHQAEVFADLNAVANATVSLGGVPLGSPLEHVNRSYIEHEDEGVYDLRFMMESDAAHEDMLKLRLAITLEAAHDLDALDTQNTLSALITGATTRRRRIAKFVNRED